MRKLLCLAVLAACELQPAPKQQPAPAAPPAPTPAEPVEAPPPTPEPGAGSAVRIDITPECMQVATRVAQVFIDSAKDPGQKSIYEQERANMTRKTGEACTTQGWSDAARACYLGTKQPADIKACERKHTLAPAPSGAAPSAAPSAGEPDLSGLQAEPRPAKRQPSRR
jgi:hypothetical protein